MSTQPGRPTRAAFEMLEPYDGKLSRTVLRGEWGGNAPDLPDLKRKWNECISRIQTLGEGI